MANNSTVALGTATQANGGMYNDIVTAAGKVIDKNYDPTGIAADPRLKIDGMLATDTTGRPLFLGEDVSASYDQQRRPRRHDRRLSGSVQQGRLRSVLAWW
jgi:hypothetical protein